MNKNGKDSIYIASALFIFERWTFGVQDALATFQPGISVFWSPVKQKVALVYFVHIVIFLSSLEQHMKHVRNVIGLLKWVGVLLSLKKSASFSNIFDYLGHIMRRDRLDVASYTADAIEGMQTLTRVTKLKSFLNFFNVLWGFVIYFDRITLVLSSKLRKEDL